MQYFVADTHFGHANIIRYCGRPFKDAFEMDRVLVENWNKKVQPQDEVIICGDMFYRNGYDPRVILDQLNGTKTLLLGNHDEFWHPKQYANYFKTIAEALYLDVEDGHHAYACHYATLGVRLSYMIHGHNHNNYDAQSLYYADLLLNQEQFLNAGVDINFFEPVSLSELIQNNREFKACWKKGYGSLMVHRQSKEEE